MGLHPKRCRVYAGEGKRGIVHVCLLCTWVCVCVCVFACTEWEDETPTREAQDQKGKERREECRAKRETTEAEGD